MRLVQDEMAKKRRLESTWRGFRGHGSAVLPGRRCRKMAKAVITLATCASREVCRPDVWKSFYSYSSPSFPSSSYINLLIRPYFISAAPLGGKKKRSSAGTASFKTIWIRLLVLSSIQHALVRFIFKNLFFFFLNKGEHLDMYIHNTAKI